MAWFQTIVQIQNELGLHARAAALLVQQANKFRSRITLEKDGQKVSGKSIMGVMMLAAGKGSNLRIIVKGVDAERAIKALEQLVEDKFGEE
ncbi:HPr family phosphocarrier protein [bacterium]|nr:HPr family phosphocarrier protein [bacterium]MCK4326616.1 HPr family phosphocarrier protein [bacterium]MCK4437158.1 HPr family phosphocarrier protein [bacterium]